MILHPVRTVALIVLPIASGVSHNAAAVTADAALRVLWHPIYVLSTYSSIRVLGYVFAQCLGVGTVDHGRRRTLDPSALRERTFV